MKIEIKDAKPEEKLGKIQLSKIEGFLTYGNLLYLVNENYIVILNKGMGIIDAMQNPCNMSASINSLLSEIEGLMEEDIEKSNYCVQKIFTNIKLTIEGS